MKTFFLRRECRDNPAAQRHPWRLRLVIWTVVAATVLAGGLTARARILMVAERHGGDAPPVDPSGGTLFIAGGGRLSESVKRQFVELAGGQNARLVIIPAAAVAPERLIEYRHDWLQFDPASVEVLYADSRSITEDPAFSAILENATGVWLGGGTQRWLTDLYRSTPVETRLRALLDRGGIVGGTSAGASAMSSVMMQGGRTEPQEGRGLGLVPEIVVDQHFLARNRIGRLMRLLDRHPNLIGLGVDEGTAAVFERKSGRLIVVGASYVVAYVPETSGGGSRMEILKAGDQVYLAHLRTPDFELVPAWFTEKVIGDE